MLESMRRKRHGGLPALVGAVFLLTGAVEVPARSSDAPVNTSPPTITGIVEVTGTITGNPGSWMSSGGAIAYAYAWDDCDPQGEGCQPLPYTSQTIESLEAPVGATIRVVVTATDAAGSASATSAPVTVLAANARNSAPTITFIRPKPGAVVHTQQVIIVVKVTSATPVGQVMFGGTAAKRGTGGLWQTTLKLDPRVQTIDIGAAGTHKQLSFTVIPPVTAVQESSAGSLTAPGCFSCVVMDPRGDDHGGPPDIKSVSSLYAHGWIVFTFVTYDTVSPAHGEHPCLFGYTSSGPNERGFDAGCFEGPHTGMVFGNACGSRQDAAGDCGSAHMSFPNNHTTGYRFRPSQIGNPVSFLWDAAVLYPGDVFKDTAPSAGARPGPGQQGLFCAVKQQLRREPGGGYGWGRRRCSQALVVTAK